jgi:hypothetical protein
MIEPRTISGESCQTHETVEAKTAKMQPTCAAQNLWLSCTRAPPHYLTYNNSTEAEHSWVTPDGVNPCSMLGAPFINNCGIDPEETFLTMFYGVLLTSKSDATLCILTKSTVLSEPT